MIPVRICWERSSRHEGCTQKRALVKPPSFTCSNNGAIKCTRNKGKPAGSNVRQEIRPAFTLRYIRHLFRFPIFRWSEAFIAPNGTRIYDKRLGFYSFGLVFYGSVTDTVIWKKSYAWANKFQIQLLHVCFSFWQL